MIKFIIAARRRPEDTQERYFYEWGIIHVALMISTPQVMRLFRKYVQHYSVSGITQDMLVHPLSNMAWDNLAEHWIESFDDFAASMRVRDYVERMQPHKFGDSNFVLMLAQGETVFEERGFAGGRGGVKLIHFLKRKPGLTHEQFLAAWCGHHARTLAGLNERQPLIRKYVQDRKLEVPSGNYSGSLFEHGDADGHDGIEEFWFRSLDDLARLAREPAWRDALLASEAEFVEAEGSFAMVTTERVVYDYSLGARSSPKPAVLDPASLEAAVHAQGFGGWNIPQAL